MFERKNPQNHPHRTNRLIRLIRTYKNKKHIKMKDIMTSVYERLMSNEPISKRQLEVIIPYLKNDLKDYTSQQIFDEFSVCIYNYPSISDYDYLRKYYPHIVEEYEYKNSPSTLEPHYV